MLAQGLIGASASAFSVLVLLVHKRDETWCFRVDHRALNALTVHDRFPIPIVDELLDELKGAVFFTKLDLAVAITKSPCTRTTCTRRRSARTTGISSSWSCLSGTTGSTLG
jgi:hypothetical protein